MITTIRARAFIVEAGADVELGGTLAVAFRGFTSEVFFTLAQRPGGQQNAYKHALAWRAFDGQAAARDSQQCAVR